MKLITRSRFKWKEPSSYYRWLRKRELRNESTWKYILKYIIIFFSMVIGTFLIGLFVTNNILYIWKVSIFSGSLICFLVWIMKFEKATVWILDDEIVYRRGNLCRQFNYDVISGIKLTSIDELSEKFDILSINFNTGEKYSIAVHEHISINKLLRFLNNKCEK